MITSIDGLIASIFVLVPRYLLFVGMILTVFVDYYNNIVLLFTGGIGGMSNFWLDYNLAEFIQLYLIGIFPFMLIAKIESSDDPVQTLTDEVKMFMEVITAVFNIAYQLFTVAFDIIKSIVGLI